ncbi:hypothetical protein [Kitasatospora sp. GAS1066B]|uniref:hypothetical protein n=1 Tax=Kitasatospora sp. GAS1066B TaxID=3156271 RepID=UPI003511419C
MSHLFDDDFVRGSLEVHLPEACVLLGRLDMAERASAEDLGRSPRSLGMYTVLPEAFYWDILRPALNPAETSLDLLGRCKDFLDELTESRRYGVLQALRIRVWEHLTRPEREILAWSGPDAVAPPS